MEKDEFSNEINNLIIDSNFLKLKFLQNKSNLFGNLAVSHIELWHSAFIKWLIDPTSDLNLDTFPLKRFLYMVVYHGRVSNINKNITLNISNIESYDFKNMIFENEFYFNNNGEKGKIDIIGINNNIRLIIENKINSSEHNDQTLKYYNYGSLSSENHEHNLYVFLSPDETATPKSEEFIQVSYQDICDFVIKPCLDHPQLKQEDKYLLAQYLHNLSKPIKGGKVMALPNKDICEEIYNAHKDVLDEIFLSVKGETPSLIQNGNKIKSYEVTLTQLVGKNILDISDKLYTKYKGKEYRANLIKQNGKVIIIFNEKVYSSLTSVGKTITNNNLNGWNFWSAEDNKGKLKGSLYELRKLALE